jgi:hypothetical protein
MKIIKLILIIVIAFFSTEMNAQKIIKPIVPIEDPIPTDYYTGYDTISGLGFSFKKIRESNEYLNIGNINNVKFGTIPYTVTPDMERPIEHLFLLAKYTDRNQVYSSVRDALGNTIINQFKSTNNSTSIDIKFIVELNGSVSEVEFLLEKNPLFFSIPPAKLYSMELLLKQRVNFIVHPRNWLPNFITGHHLSVTIKDL